MESFWSGVGAAATVGALIVAWLHFRASSSGLVAKVSANRFSLPSYLADGPRLVKINLGSADFVSGLEGVSRENAKKISEEMNKRIDDIFPEEARYSTANWSAYWTIDVANKGHRIAEDVALRIPQAKRVRIVREGKETIEQDVSVLIELGNIRPGETIAVVAWSAFYYNSDLKEIQLVQKSGRAKVLRFERVSPFWKSVSEYWGPLLIVLLWIVWIVGSSIK